MARLAQEQLDLEPRLPTQRSRVSVFKDTTRPDS